MMKKIKYHLYLFVESLIRNIGGLIGEKIRYAYYSRRFKACGCNVKIDVGVIFENIDNISIGDNVWFLPYSMLTARPKNHLFNDRIVECRSNVNFIHAPGELVIGNEVSIGAYNILQGYGGLVIGDRVTTSARVSLYSFSHFPNNRMDLSEITYANSMVKSNSIACIESPIVVGEAVWLGLGVTVFSGTIGPLSFITANSVVLKDIKENSVASGTPAQFIKERFSFDK